MKKYIMTVVLMSLITAMASAQKLYPYKSSKKNYKTMKRSTMLADANRSGNASKSSRELAKMQEKQEKQNKKSGLFK